MSDNAASETMMEPLEHTNLSKAFTDLIVVPVVKAFVDRHKGQLKPDIKVRSSLAVKSRSSVDVGSRQMFYSARRINIELLQLSDNPLPQIVVDGLAADLRAKITDALAETVKSQRRISTQLIDFVFQHNLAAAHPVINVNIDALVPQESAPC